MSIDLLWGDSFAPAQAERGKFVPVDTSTITSLGYPATGAGKFALLTYALNPTTISLSGASLSLSLTSVAISVGNTTQLSSVTLVSAVPQVINFTPMVNTVEILNNNSTKTVYLLWGSTTISVLTSQGMVLGGGAYYAIDRATTQLTLGSIEDNINVRVFGHYGA